MISVEKEEFEQLVEYLEEIESITIGADSPDANELAKKNPKKAIKLMEQDMAAISKLITKINELKMFY